jgi:hypothetical protein
MRLTLRTLLAYLDDILDPEDAEALGLKIRESDFASGLVHRIRSVAGRLRLSAPPVEGRGLGADANTVAEYLDNTLPADRIPEFEKVCLESDMHLSEVASSHQVLTLVLGEPAYVDLDLRNRVHNLAVASAKRDAATDAAAHRQQAGDETVPAVAVTDKSRRHPAAMGEQATRRPRPARDSDWRGDPAEAMAADVSPDDLLSQNGRAAGRRSAFPGWLAALVAGFLITAAVIVAVRSFMQGPKRAIDLADATSMVPQRPPGLADTPVDAGTSADATERSGDVAKDEFASDLPATGEPAQGPLSRGSEFQTPSEVPFAPPLAATEPPAASTVDPAASTVDPTASTVDVAASTVDVAGGMFDDPNQVESPPDRGMASPAKLEAMRSGTGPASDLSATEQPPPEALAGAPSSANAVEMNADRGAVEPTAPDVTAPDVTALDGWPAEKPKDLGRLASEDQILAVWDDGKGAWQRLPARAVLLDGAHLRVPTLFRPHLMLSSGIQVTLNDRTDMRLEATEDGSRLAFGFGQAIFSLIGDTRAVSLRFGDQPVTVTLGDGQSHFAVELQDQRLPGKDPFQAGNTVSRAKIWPTRTSIEIQIGDGPTQSVQPGSVWVLAGGAAVIDDGESVPGWVAVPKRREIDRQALARLASTIKVDRSLTLELFEAAENSKRNELRSLAARALASLGQFGPLVASFGDKKQHYAWNAHYDELLAGLARDPDSAQRVREAANKYWGTSADRLLKMVIGYGPEDLRRRGAAELVASLSEEQLEARVIAIETLRRITGKSQLFFPERPSVRRREPTRKWQQLLETGEIVYRQWPPEDYGAASSPQ